MNRGATSYGEAAFGETGAKAGGAGRGRVVSATATERGDVRADVAIVGAGPAGAVAALVLARAGLDVVLIDRAPFPRDKACGDGLMPDALAALRALGLADRALAGARRLAALRLCAPNGTAITLNGEFAVVPRERFDACLCEAAVEAGARFLRPVRVVAPIDDDGGVAGVVGETPDGETVLVHARMTVLATGAGAGPLTAFGVCDRSQPSATAARFYITLDSPASFDLDCLCISYERSICPGYGWIFPGPAGSFNVGVGYFYQAPPATRNLRQLMARFLDTFPPARDLARLGGCASPIRGAPLRTGMSGARWSSPGLLVAGDAAGLTYPISGEGIGKAMESGMLAAEIAGEGLRAGRTAEAIADAYAGALEAKYLRRFQAYTNAQRWVAHPGLVDFLARRANAGTYVRQQIEGLVNETAEPGAILSVRGILRSLFT
jgi:geranylgeranyl reductase family protein